MVRFLPASLRSRPIATPEPTPERRPVKGGAAFGGRSEAETLDRSGAEVSGWREAMGRKRRRQAGSLPAFGEFWS